MARWIITGRNGEHLHQVVTKGSEEPTRDCPEGHGFIRVARHSHDPAERYDEKLGRWVKCPDRAKARAAAERATAEAWLAAIPDGALDLLVERVRASLAGEAGN